MTLFTHRISNKLFFFIASFFLCCIVATAQDVDPLTGRAVVNLPIWTMKSGSLNSSIGLSYTGGNGIKVNDSEGSAGVGWNMYAGGSINRQVRGLPDDYVGPAWATGDQRYGWLHQNICRQAGNFTPSADLNYSACDDEAADWNTLNSFGYLKDTEPDIFSFNAPGLSGQFVFDNNKLVRTIPYQDLKIVLYRQGADSLINMIEITTNLGVKYTFLAGDQVKRTAALFDKLKPAYQFTSALNYYQKTAIFYSSWNLTSVVHPAGSSISYNYGNTFESVSPSYSQIYNSTTAKIDTVYSVTDDVSGGMISSISAGNELATFSWNGTVLGSVSIKDNSYNLVKKFNLTYKSQSQGVGRGKTKRYFLTQLAEQVNCNSYPGYQFTYYGVDFATNNYLFNSPLKQDLFGYYNGTATSLVPKIYNNESATDGERYRIANATGYTEVTTGGGRAVDSSKVYYGALARMTMPSGGYSEIKYEPTDYYDAVTNSNQWGAGVRVKRIKIAGGNPGSDVTMTYRYRSYSSPTKSSGQWIYRPMFVAFSLNGPVLVPYNIAPDEAILYYRTEVSVMGRGKTVYEYQNPGLYNVTSSGDFAASLTRLARNYTGVGNCESLGTLRSGYYTFPHAPNTNYDFERGLLKRISEYTRSGQLVTRKSYTYQRTTLSTVNVSGVRFEQISDIFQYSKYNMLANVNKITQTESSRIYDKADTDSTNYIETVSTYTYNGNQMLSQVATTNSDNNTFYKNYTYAKDYATTGTDTQSSMINALVNTNQHGTLVESVSKTGSTVTGAQLTLFNNNFGYSRVLPMQQLTLGDLSSFTPSSVVGSNFTYASTKYYPSLFVDAYDDFGNATIIRDRSRATRSTILGHYNSAPIADIQNARYDQVVYYDFEPGQSQTINATGTTTTTNSEAWTGKYSFSMAAGSTLQKTGVVKGTGNFYRFSCWIKASAATSFSVQINNGGGWVSTTANYTNANAWQYVEQRIDVSSVTTGNTFSFQLSVPAAVLIDNIAFYPETARITEHAYEPLNGKTADINTRGIAGFQDYDAMGRVHYLKNQDKDIVSIKDYHYKSANGVAPNSHFTSSISLSAIKCTSSVTFTVDPDCLSGLVYAWYIDDVVQSSTSTTMTYQFTDNKDYSVKLVVSSNLNGSSVTDIIVHPLPNMIGSLTLGSGQGFTANCQDQHRDFTATISSGCYDAGSLRYTWYVNTMTGNGEPQTDNTFSIEVGATTTIICVVTGTCLNPITGNHDPVTVTLTRTITWNPNGNGC